MLHNNLLKNFLALTLMVVCSSSLLNAATIRGSVSGLNSDGTPMALLGVNVWLVGSDFGVETSADGSFELKGVKAGRYQIQFSRIGSVTERRWIEVKSDDSHFMLTVNQSLENDIIVAPGVSVVGTRPVADGKVEGSVTVIGFDEVSEQHALGAEELLRRAPGVTVAGDDGLSNRANVGIRGLYPRRSARVLILEDGAPVQPAPYLAPSAYYNPPTERIDMIEVVKGSSALSFGPQTLGGVINYITKQPPSQKRVSLNLSGGENGYGSSYLKLGNTQGGFGYDLQLLYKNFDGFRDNTGFALYSGVAKFIWTPSARSAFGAKLNVHAEDAQATYSALTQYEFETNPQTNRLKDDFLDTDRRALDLTHHYQLNQNTTLQSQAFYSNFTRNWWRENSELVAAQTQYADAGADDLIRVGKGDNKARLREFKVFGAQSDLSHHYMLGDLPQQFSFGIRFEADKFWNDEEKGVAADSRTGVHSKDEYYRALALAAYVRNTIRVSENITLTPGLRVESFEQKKDKYDFTDNTNSLTEKTTTEALPGLMTKVSFESVYFFAGAHRGFSPPTDKTAFLNTDDVAVNYDPDGDLDSEKSWNFEAGLNWDAYEWLHIEPAVFLMDIENMIAAGRKATFENLGSVRYKGVELGASANLGIALQTPFSLRLETQWTHVRSEIKEGLVDEQGFAASTDVSGNEAPYAPRNTVRVGLNLGFMRDRLRIAADYNSISSQFADFNNTVAETAGGDNGIIPAYHFINVSTSYKLNKRGMMAFVSVKNIENNIYRSSRLHRASSGIFPGGFRQINAGLSLPLVGTM